MINGLLAAGCGLLMVPLTASAQSATVRGQANCAVAGRPAAGWNMTVFSARFGRSKPAQVGANGKFYLYNIPVGRYVLEAWKDPTSAPRTFQLQVFAPYTDVPPIQVGC